VSPERAGGLEGDLAAWRALVEKGLRGGDISALTTSTLDSPALAPLYTERDRPATEGVPFAARGLPSVGRVIEPPVDLAEERSHGATLAWLPMLPREVMVPDGLEVVIEGDDPRLARAGVRTLVDPWSARIAGGQSADESLLQRPLADLSDAIGARAPALGANGTIWSDAGANAIEEIAWTLASFVESLRALERKGLALEAITERATVALSVGQDLFVEIAKLRAMRRVLARALDACGVSARPRLATRTARRMIAGIDRDTNLVRTTLAASAALIGGADAVAIASHSGERPELAARLARNVPLVLTLEAHLAPPTDPARGSYYVEALTADLARRAWDLFREVEARGGIASAAESIRGRLDASRARRAQAIATRRSPIVGVSRFPVPADRASAEGTSRDPGRDSDGFEAMRASASGLRAQVWIVPGCPEARVSFAREVCAVAGLEVEIVEHADLARATAPIVLIAAADGALAAAVPALIVSLWSSAPAVRVIAVAARPGPDESALRAAGVDALVHASSDLIATMGTLIERARLARAEERR
jgi:methylmalonyl-CoA mutase